MEPMTVYVDVRPEVFDWARRRSGIDPEVWAERFPRFESWRDGDSKPTVKQLQEFARKTYTPVGFLFLDAPPHESVPLPDFRTVASAPVAAPTADLLDVIYLAQARQEWYRDHQLLNGEGALPFMSSATTESDVVDVANRMRVILQWTTGTRAKISTVDDAVAKLREAAEAAGVLVMISGIVGSNTHRPLDRNEFRGFALVDPYASVVFVNGVDSKTAQLFTLAHELAHVWLGQTALSDLGETAMETFRQERWCNSVAAELLVPAEEFLLAADGSAAVRPQLAPLAKTFKVSTEVILGRFRELLGLSWDEYNMELGLERQRLGALAANAAGGSGGNYYNTKPVQVGKRFARELIASALEGRTTYAEAFRLLGVSKTKTFLSLGRQLGVA
jgi:Zn-dependent peptidase ImmA (M78 family)